MTGCTNAVDRRRRPALELAVLGQELGAHRDVGVGPLGRGDLARAPLVRVVHVRVDEVDHERLGARAPGAGAPRRAPASSSSGTTTWPSASMRSSTSRRRSRGISGSKLPLSPYGVGRVRRPSSSTSRKPARRDEPRPRALALEQRVGRGGRPVHDHLQLGRRRRRARAAPPAHRRPGCATVVGTFATRTSPVASSMSTRSVKVPPTSTPTSLVMAPSIVEHPGSSFDPPIGE